MGNYFLIKNKFLKKEFFLKNGFLPLVIFRQIIVVPIGFFPSQLQKDKIVFNNYVLK